MSKQQMAADAWARKMLAVANMADYGDSTESRLMMVLLLAGIAGDEEVAATAHKALQSLG